MKIADWFRRHGKDGDDEPQGEPQPPEEDDGDDEEDDDPGVYPLW